MGSATKAFLRLLAEYGEATGWAPRWFFYWSQAAKVNAALWEGNYRKLVTCARHVVRERRPMVPERWRVQGRHVLLRHRLLRLQLRDRRKAVLPRLVPNDPSPTGSQQPPRRGSLSARQMRFRHVCVRNSGVRLCF